MHSKKHLSFSAIRDMITEKLSIINLPTTESNGYESGVNACLQKLKFSHLTQNPQNPSHPIL